MKRLILTIIFTLLITGVSIYCLTTNFILSGVSGLLLAVLIVLYNIFKSRDLKKEEIKIVKDEEEK